MASSSPIVCSFDKKTFDKTNERFLCVALFQLWFTSIAHSHLMCISPFVDTQLFVIMHQIHIYFICLTLEREGGLHILSFVLLARFWKWIYICHADWRQNITAALKLVHFIHCSLCNYVSSVSLAFGNLSSVSIWPYFSFSMHKHRLVEL